MVLAHTVSYAPDLAVASFEAAAGIDDAVEESVRVVGRAEAFAPLHPLLEGLGRPLLPVLGGISAWHASVTHLPVE